ncbi:MAG: excinuclease ABC subunit UvrA [Bacteroidota bacterium]
MQREIIIEGARENNLKNVNLRIPHYRLIVVTGVSGSGKSSLVHDVISREGQRLFIDHFTGGNYQSEKKLSKPKADSIQGLFPVVSVNQNSVVRNPRSTVGTLTEINDYLRLLFARLGTSATFSAKADRSLFSYNSPKGYCPVCKGLGVEDHIDPELIVDDETKSLREGALVLSTPNGYIIYSQVTLPVLDQVCRAEGFNVDIPWHDLTDEQKNIVWYGSEKIKVLFGKHPLESRLRWTGITAKPRAEEFYKGILPVMEEILRRERNPNIMRFVRSFTCPSCYGKRLNEQALSFRLWGLSIADFSAMSLQQIHQWFSSFSIPVTDKQVADPVVEAIIRRSEGLCELGLGYLTLNRESTGLSGGEAQRIRLGNQVATGLRNVLYLLDEPSAGLHPSDHHKLLGVIRKLVNNGNTAIVVEHDEQTMHAADWIIDIGPGPGEKGGEILYNGPAKDFLNVLIPKSITSQFLKHPHRFEADTTAKNKTFFEIADADKNNLKHINVHFAFNTFNVLTGVSGSGKSSLAGFLIETIIPAKSGGTGDFRKVIHLDQSPIGRTPNSNPATYTGLSDYVRDLLAALPESKQKGFKKGQFSFVVKGGRCDACNGAGTQQLGMHFLGNIEVPCEECNGKRFTEETLDIKYNGKNIFEILELSIDEAHEFFNDQKKIVAITSVLIELGLGYIKLGQRSTTLSGGEAQRVKLASELARPANGNVLYVLDEPTTGLHMADTEVLINALTKLVNKGNTVLAIEHDPNFILRAGWVADLGPGGGDDGGNLIIEGTPQDVIECASSLTGKSLKAYIEGNSDQYNNNKKNIFNTNEAMSLHGVSTNNLKNLDISIPFNSITAVTGVSGSGKSSLVFDTFYAESQRRFMDGLSSYVRQFIGKTGNPVLDSCNGLTPAISVQKKNPLKNPRSTVATYSGLYDLYRLLYSRLGKDLTGNRMELSSAFSFNNEQGACPVCKGLGLLTVCDENKLITDATLPIIAGALDGTITGKFYGDPYGQYVHTLLAVGKVHNLDFSLPFLQLTSEARNLALYGCDDEIFEVEWKYKRGSHEGTHNMKAQWPGFCGHINTEYERKHDGHRGDAMMHLMTKKICPVCDGNRLKPELLIFRIGFVHIGQLCSWSADEAIPWFRKDFANCFSSDAERATAYGFITEIVPRLESLVKAGLGYIGLGRLVSSLSGGEFQRLKLAALMRSSITGITYVLDEPSFGLHRKDILRMRELIESLNSNGNNVLMVEMSPALLDTAQHVIELGPSAGKAGGTIIYSGLPADVTDRMNQIIESALTLSRQLPDGLTIEGAYANNLKNINVRIPSRGLIAITGVSGSGKTSLLSEVIYNSYNAGKAVNCSSVKGFENFDDLLLIEQDVPVGSAMSIPATWLGIADSLKKIFGATASAKEAGFKESAFSFLSRDGQCPDCKGSGNTNVSLDFWSDAQVTCETCKGKRYRSEILKIKIEDLSIADVLELPFTELAKFLERNISPKARSQVSKILMMAERTGIGYLTAGQPMNTLSAGELQRLKLVAGLSGAKSHKMLYLLDEPTGGLHPEDTLHLLLLFDELIDRGASIICVTHDEVVMAHADYIIELGPAGGQNGGYVISAS